MPGCYERFRTICVRDHPDRGESVNHGGMGESGGVPAGGVRWAAWTPDDVHARLRAADVPWCVAAGWAVDLFVGRQTREHGDLEVAVPRSGWSEVRSHLAELTFSVADDGHLWPLDQAHLDRSFQTWGFDHRGIARVDVFREPHDGSTWICRRHEELRRPYADVIEVSADGIPYLAPEIVLLFKAKRSSAKDEHDLRTALPLMDAARRSWLRSALQRLHPGHPWLDAVPAG
jgi:Aminoglycoside-2''-adenylyltransferase